MRVCVTSTHSPAYAELAEVTTPNHIAYCERHGYDYLSRRTAGVEWPNFLPDDLNRIRNLVGIYDVVLKVETDVVFTNMSAHVEDYIHEKDIIVVGREPKGRAVLNVGVMIFVNQWNEVQPFLLLSKIIDEAQNWLGRSKDCYWQNHLGRMVSSHHPYARCVRLVEPRLINATDQTESPEWTWESGDFVCHCGGGSVESRIERCRIAMAKAAL